MSREQSPSPPVEETASERIEPWLRRFEEAWQQGRRPRIEDHLPPADPDRRAALVEMVHVDLEWRLNAGEPALAEDYLERFPELEQDREQAVELIAAEYRLRLRREPDLRPRKFLDRFPRFAADLAERLAADAPPSGPVMDQTEAPDPTGTGARQAWPDTVAGAGDPVAGLAPLTMPTDDRSGKGPVPASARDFLAPPQQADEIGRLGGYRVLKVLGAGGMGVVFLGEDPKLKRRVALKAMKPAVAASASAGQRFLQEAQATAAVKHDHVVTIHQVGEEGGAPFLAMEFLEGESLDDRLQREKKLPVGEVLRIGREMARGLEAAHEHGLIHRDVKPGNVWLEGQRGRVKILDFGLARPTVRDSHLTQEGAIVGTPAYMAPEQAQGKKVDVRCDLFSLGVVLYRLSTGHMPFIGADALSTLVAISSVNPKPPAELNPELPQALSALILRLLAKDPAERPASAGEAAEALAAIEADQTQPSPAGKTRAGQPPRRRRGWLVAAIAAGILFLGGGAFLAPVLIRIYDSKGKEVGKAEIPEGGMAVVERPGQPPVVVDRKKRQDNPFDAFRREKIPADEMAAAGGGEPKQAPFGLVGVLGDSRLKHWAAVHSVAVSPDGKRLVSGGEDKTVRVWDAATGKEVLVLKTLDSLAGVALSSDGKRIAAGFGSQVKVWDAGTGKVIHTLNGHQKAVLSVAFTPDGLRLASGSYDQTVKVWDLATGKPLHTLRGLASIRGVAFSPDSKRLASAAGDNGKPGEVRVWDAGAGKELCTLGGFKGPITSVAFSPDGKRLVTAEGTFAKTDGVKVWDASTGKELLTVASGQPAMGAAFSPDGKRLAVAGLNPASLKLWHAETGEPLLTFQGHVGGVNCVAFSKDGKRLASGGRDQTVRLWDVATGQELLPHKGHISGVTGVAVSDDGKVLASGGGDRTVKLWDAAAGKEVATLQRASAHLGGMRVALRSDGRRLASHDGYTGGVKLWDVPAGKEILTLKAVTPNMAISSDGLRLVTNSKYDTLLRVWDGASGKEVLTFDGRARFVSCLAISPEGKRLASGPGDATVKVWDAATGKECFTLKRGREVAYAAAFSPDGTRLAATGARLTTIWDLASGKELLSHSVGGNIAWSPDGKTLATADNNGRVILWDASSGKKVDQWQMQGAVHCIAFAADGRHLITGNGNSTIYVLRLDPALDSLRREQIPAHELAAAGGGDPNKAPAELVGVFGDSRLKEWDDILALAVTSDGKRLASAGTGGKVRIWDASTGREVLTFVGHTAKVNSLAFSPNGKLAASASWDGSVKVWDASTGRLELNLKTHVGAVEGVAFSKDGKLLTSCGNDQTVKIWNAATGQEMHSLKGHAGRVVCVAFSSDGKRIVSAGDDKSARVWDVATAKEILAFKGHVNGVRSAAFSPDGKRVVSGGGGSIKLWDASTGQEILSRKVLAHGATGVTFSPDGKRIAATTNQHRLGGLNVWDAVTGMELLHLKTPDCRLNALAYSSDGKRIITACNDRRVRIWDAFTGKDLFGFEGHGLPAASTALSLNGKWIATVEGTTVKLWNVETAEVVHTFPGRGRVRFTGFSPDSFHLAASCDNVVRVWNLESGAEIRALKGHTNWVYGFAFSPDGKQLVSCGWDKVLKVWDLATGKDLLTLKGHLRYVQSVAYSPDGTRIVSGGNDGLVKVWDARTGKETPNLKANASWVAAVSFSPDGKRVGIAGYKSLTIWDPEAGKGVLPLKGHAGSPTNAAFAPDSKTLASADSSGRIILWDAATGQKKREWQAPGPVQTVLFAPCGRHLITSNANYTVYVLRLAERGAEGGRPLTPGGGK